VFDAADDALLNIFVRDPHDTPTKLSPPSSLRIALALESAAVLRQLSRLLLGVALVAISVPALAQPPASREPVRYVVRFPAPQTNYLEVEARIPTDGRAAIEVMMPVWTPGSYLVREYEKNVENVVATAGGHTVPVDKTLKNRWRITPGGPREVTLTYRVFSHEMSVRNNWVDVDFALVNGAQTFITLADAPGPGAAYERPYDVRLELPPAWKTSVTGMPDASDGRPNHFAAADYDTLVDSPIVAGNPAIHSFTVDGKPHLLVDVGEDGLFDGERAIKDLRRIVETNERFWGSLPYDKYVFFNLLIGAGGGIEHRNSVMMMASRWSTTNHVGYLSWLGLASHEYFHLWNVKRLRPIELGPFDYEHENYPRSLWVSEGLTDYYGGLQLVRAGLQTQAEYLVALSRGIGALQTTPGRLTRSVEMASFDAWIKEYRPDENSVNSTVSYYTKGEVLGFLLDAQIRAASKGAKSLDDVMRLAFSRYSGTRGFTPDDFRRTASEVAGTDLSTWFNRALDTTDELDYQPALDWYGLQFMTKPARPESGDVPGWIGARTRNDNGRLVVDIVPGGTPAYEAGVNPGDEIVAIDDLRVLPGDLDRRLEFYHPGQTVTLLVARRQELKRIPVTLGAAPADKWNLAVRSDASPEQRGHLATWLK
jgi:predicted metalloprotease with PDZ domain